MKKRIILSLLILALVSACNLPTVFTQATAAATITPTVPSYPTGTAVSTLPPFVPTLTATPDLRVIAASAQTFKLRLSDLPMGYAIKYNPSCFDLTDPQCKLASDLIEGPELNYEILQEYGFEKGSAYINDTQRIEGWYIVYSNENAADKYPQTIVSNTIRFANADGARKFVETYEEALLNQYTKVSGYPSIGDSSNAFSRIYSKWIYFTFVFSYKNMAHRIGLIGASNTITPDLIQDLAFKALQKLQAAESDFPSQYVSPPTLTPSADTTPSQSAAAPRLIDLVLSQSDLPAKGGYRLPDKNASSPYHNDEVMQRYEDGQASAYIAETGRVDGWEIRYKRGKNDVLLPAEMYDNLILFQTAEGALKYMDQFTVKFLEAGYQENAPQKIIGDATRLFVKKDGVFVKYMLEFSYRNYVHRLQGYGLQAEIDPAFIEMTAFTLLQKLQATP